MSSSQNPLTLPSKEPRRKKALNIRLSEQERHAVEKLAEMQGVSASALGRHFVMLAVGYYQRKMQGGEGAAHDPET
ncbi:MAG: hypothetical protein K8I82_06635 [Anaerolineae bacterium]|nr:hypothetical protein [Anaerolineae bacterium]